MLPPTLKDAAKRTGAVVAACLPAILLYLYFSLPRLALPGLNADEAMEAFPALPLLGLTAPHWGENFQVWHLALPIGCGPYHGALTSYLVAPFIRVLGTTPEALRLYSVSVGVLTLISFFLLVRSIAADSVLACFAATLLAIHPTFVSGMRNGFMCGSILLFFLTAALTSLLRWHRSREARGLWLGCFLIGCGISCRGWFLYPLFALAVMGLAYEKSFLISEFKTAPRRLARLLLGAVSCLSLGSILFILTLVWKYRTVISQYMAPTLSAAISGGVLNYLQSLQERALQLASLVTRDATLNMQFPNPGGYGYWFDGPLFYACLLGLTISLFKKHARFSRPKKLFFLCFIPAFLIVSPLTLSTHKLEHMFPIFPILVIVIVLAIGELQDLLQKNWRITPSVFVLVAGIVLDAPQLQARLRTMQDVHPHYSDAIYGLASWVKKNRVERLGALDWGFVHNLTYLLAGNVQVDNRWDWYDPTSLKPGSLYVTYAPFDGQDFTSPSARLLNIQARRAGLKVFPVQRWVQRDGKLAILLLRLGPANEFDTELRRR